MKKVMLLIAAVILRAACCSARDAQPANAETEVNITKFGAKGDGKKVATKAINKAIEKAENGAKVVIPAGKYLTGTIVLKSNITLEIEEGAELIGVDDIDAYSSYKPTRDMSRYDTGEGTRNSDMASD